MQLILHDDIMSHLAYPMKKELVVLYLIPKRNILTLKEWACFFDVTYNNSVGVSYCQFREIFIMVIRFIFVGARMGHQWSLIYRSFIMAVWIQVIYLLCQIYACST